MLKEWLALDKSRMHILERIGKKFGLEYPEGIREFGAPKLYIFKTCENVVREILQWIGKDKNDHLISCVAGDTKIVCERGHKKIKDIVVGEKVFTRQGFKKVLASGMSNPEASVYRLDLSNGEQLIITGNHPVYCPEKQKFIPVEDLRVGVLLFDYQVVGEFEWANAPVRLIAVTKLEDKIPVYNLSVEDAPEYFADGVLVHNCLKFFTARDRQYQTDYSAQDDRDYAVTNRFTGNSITGY
jgi:hypothetical protein